MKSFNLTIKLYPHEKFKFYWDRTSGYNEKNSNHIYIGDVDFVINRNNSIKLTIEQNVDITNFMKQEKTEVVSLSDNKFYTIVGDNLCEIQHPKLK